MLKQYYLLSLFVHSIVGSLKCHDDTIPTVLKCYDNTKFYLKNAYYVDFETQKIVKGEVLISNGHIESVQSHFLHVNKDYKEIDLNKGIITPGWIDFHTHAYYGGTYWGIQIDAASIESGVTTVIDAGSSGAFNYLNFKNSIIETSQIDIVPFLNIAANGLTLRTGELLNTELTVDIDSIKYVLGLYREIKGIKVRLDKYTTKDGNLTALLKTREVADQYHIPLMIHIGHSPPTIENIEPYLKKGDIITHFYNGHGNKLIKDDYKTPKEVLLKLKQKGVILDVGHGGGGFNYKVAKPLIEKGYLPDTVSSDLHQISRMGTAKNLLNVFNKLWALDIPLVDLLSKVTLTPAKILNLEKKGLVKQGYKADLAVFKIVNGEFNFTDTADNFIIGNKKLVNLLTFKNGKLLHKPIEPGPFPWALRDAGIVSGNKP